ncbi:MAG TPA: NAD(P)/FAD-dependent oxidoreductase [Chloroflexota bacterium]|nr:NAD(P)/FAD-dependent oxidoreductase [Chloroflexota bacterium]
MEPRPYDVAIAGGSFAGLALALQLRGRVVLVDHNAIGAGQTSACGTTVAALHAVGALDTIQQRHDDLVLHLAPQRGRERALTYRLPYSFCTFDYTRLCRLLADRLAGRGVEIVRARATGWKDGRLVTDRGDIEARCVVDATGWRAAVASTVQSSYVLKADLSCGLEAELSQPKTNYAQGLHFWAGHATVWPGSAWSFPAGPVARLGVIAYPDRNNDPSKDLREALDLFLDGPGAAYWSPDGERAWQPGEGRPTAGRHLHGGFLPAAARSPVVGEVFTVGDAAGHCFGLTGEGIRAALASALTCGALLQRTIDGHLTPAQARAAYRRHVALRLPYWRLMRLLQAAVSRMSDGGLARYSAAAAPPPIFWFLMQQYLWPARP